MTQVMSVSATAAGYIADTLKPAQKVGQPNYVEQINKQITAKRFKTEKITRNAVVGLKDSSALGLFFLQAGANRAPRASLKQTEEAYQETESLALTEEAAY